MKIHISNYIFSAGAGTITFLDYAGQNITLSSILLIANVTRNTIIYNFAQTGFGGTVSGNVLTLAQNTSAMSNSDSLLIYYDDNNIPAMDATTQSLLDAVSLLKRIAEYTSVLDTTDSNQRLRVNVDAAGTSASAAGLVVASASCAILANAGAIVTNGTTAANATHWND